MIFVYSLKEYIYERGCNTEGLSVYYLKFPAVGLNKGISEILSLDADITIY